ncbi:MAG: class B sortase [Eubacterium sp.]|nr:class B sortase [Eubacterium sp.]MCM1214328.1 class B sortase [Lachnospiraceae bacterium]MCM1304993.1 class B sortase [Butyrivibrio sp.]MCM1344338.1 class B sortase [Muribaculaceae bacterium]MCM1238620.1 class B sortase [Lachnospiraceae bacterium]
MAQKVFVVEGRQFRTQSDYARAVHDKEIIDKLRKETNLQDKAQLERLKADLKAGKYKFMTLLGQDFRDEVEERLKTADTGKKQAGKKGRKGSKRQESGRNAQGGGNAGKTPPGQEEPEIDEAVLEELRKQDRRRKLVIALCSVAAVGCLGYFGIYSYHNYRTRSTYESLSSLRDMRASAAALPADPEATPQYTLDNAPAEPREVLEEFKILLNKNQKLIGWLKIDDTNIDYPVMQTTDNEYYLDHNLNQEYDRNGSIFMDKDCDVLEPSTNYILYGHHMKSGQMFGYLDRYSSEKYYEEHPYIQFDTIYEEGIYQVMYVFRSHVYSEDEIAFKYYQFIDVNSEQEFDSYMQEMAAMSYYDTGVTAEYGDQLLTLSTCDYQEKDGRFVVVAKKIAKE